MKYLLQLAACALLLLTVGCGGKSTADAPTISVSMPMQQTLVHAIAGDGLRVNTLLPPGTDPETFDPSVQTLSELSRSKAYLTLGTPGFEQNLMAKAKESFPGVEVIDVAKGISIIDGTHAGHEADPHITSSVRNAALIAANITEALCRLYPDSAAAYRKAGAREQQRLRQLDDSIARVLSRVPGTSFVVMHPSLSYFARDYGLRQIAMESEGKEASPRELQQRMEAARQAGARVLIHDRDHASARAEELARQMGLRLVPVALNGPDWQSELLNAARAIAEAGAANPAAR